MTKETDWTKKEIWSARDLVKAGFSRSMAYALFSRPGVPVVRLGGRVFVIREQFQAWLKSQSSGNV